MTDAEKRAITKYDLLYEQRMTRVETEVDILKNNINEIRENSTGRYYITNRRLFPFFPWIMGIVLGTWVFSIILIFHHSIKTQ